MCVVSEIRELSKKKKTAFTIYAKAAGGYTAYAFLNFSCFAAWIQFKNRALAVY